MSSAPVETSRYARVRSNPSLPNLDMESRLMLVPDESARMTKEEYFNLIPVVFEHLEKLIHAKNTDYTGGKNQDPFGNFRKSVDEGVAPIRGLRMRMSDKEQRVRTYLSSGELKVVGETVYEAILDRIGYSLLELAMFIELHDDRDFVHRLKEKTDALT